MALGLVLLAEGEAVRTTPPTQNGRAFRIWEKVKQAAKILRPILAAAVLIAIVAYLAATWNVGSKEAQDAGTFSVIGTVEIIE